MKKYYVNSWGSISHRFFRKRNLKKAMRMMFIANADDGTTLLAA